MLGGVQFATVPVQFGHSACMCMGASRSFLVYAGVALLEERNVWEKERVRE